MEKQLSPLWDKHLSLHPEAAYYQTDFFTVLEKLITCFEQGGKLMLCGNGGSAADCEHIAGELMKGFLKQRPLPKEQQDRLQAEGAEGELLAQKLQGALPCIALTGHPALTTAFSNDVEPSMTFAQQVWGYGRKGDVLLAISTSGNAKNVRLAVLAAKAQGVCTIGLTGRSGGKLLELCDLTLRVDETETYRVQEQHLALYHTLCAMLEAHFFEE